VRTAISDWPITIPRTSPLSPSTSSAIESRLILFARSFLSSTAFTSTTYSPITPISTKKADVNATFSDGVNVANQRRNTHVILNIQKFICAFLLLNAVVRLWSVMPVDFKWHHYQAADTL